MDDGVELVAVDDQEVAAVGSYVGVAVGDLDAAEMRALERPQELVVIAGDVDDARALAALAQQLLDHVVVRLRPVPGAAQPPAVDDVADQIDRLGVVVAQEVEQELGLGRLRAEMDVRDEQRPEFAGCVASHAPTEPFLLPSLCPNSCNRCVTVAGHRSPALCPRAGSRRKRVMDLGIKGKKAIVCASSRGLGRGCALALAEAGCDLVVNGRDAKALAATAQEIRDRFGVNVTEVLGDVSQPDDPGRAAGRLPPRPTSSSTTMAARRAASSAT